MDRTKRIRRLRRTNPERPFPPEVRKVLDEQADFMRKSAAYQSRIASALEGLLVMSREAHLKTCSVDARAERRARKMDKFVNRAIPGFMKLLHDTLHPKPFKPFKFRKNYKPPVMVGSPASGARSTRNEES